MKVQNKFKCLLLPKQSQLASFFGFSLIQIIILANQLLLTQSCYKFPADMKDPCHEKECRFGAQCKPTIDGRNAECVCPTTCATYGDSRGSRPVCGTDGRDYPNVCELRRHSCKEMKEISVKFTGACGESIAFIIMLLNSNIICILFA